MNIVAHTLRSLMTSQAIYQEGVSAGFAGKPQDANPYRKGWERFACSDAAFAGQWDSGWYEGWSERQETIDDKHKANAR